MSLNMNKAKYICREYVSYMKADSLCMLLRKKNFTFLIKAIKITP